MRGLSHTSTAILMGCVVIFGVVSCGHTPQGVEGNDSTTAMSVLEMSCAKGDGRACGRLAQHVADAGDLPRAFALVEPHCRPGDWESCRIGADISRRWPLVVPADWSPSKAPAVPARVVSERRVAPPRSSNAVCEILVGVTKHGDLAVARVVRSAGPFLDTYSIFMVRRVQWEPARGVDGRPVDSWFRYRVRYEP